MKNIFITLTFLFSLISFADCEQSYQVYKSKTKNYGNILSRSGVAAPPTGVLAFLTAIRFDITGAAFLAGSGATSVAAAPVLSTLGGISYIKSSNYKWVNEIIRQSKVGMGLELEEWAEDLSEEFDRDLTALEVADAVDTANTEKVFCPEGQKPFSKFDFKDYVVEMLQE